MNNKFDLTESAEKKVLGAFIVDDSLLHVGIEMIDKDSFNLKVHAAIFQAMIELMEHSQPLNPQLIYDVLRKNNEDHLLANGIAHLENLAKENNENTSLEDLCKILKQTSQRKKMLSMAKFLEEQSTRNPFNLYDILNHTYTMMVDLDKTQRVNRRPLNSHVMHLIRELENPEKRIHIEINIL